MTALVVQDFYRGDLLRGVIDGESHYWNRLPGGVEVDLTRHQFRADATISKPQQTSRQYVLAFPDTRQRYERLKSRTLEQLQI